MKRKRGQVWLLLAALLLAAALKFVYPAGAAYLRAYTAAAFAADAEKLSAVEALGRALAGGDLRGELVAVIGRAGENDA
ncbi:MAG: hypothetical protein IIU18_02805 [Oscillospiraceae bacterium]|nr:hypothetical protein [Oscillospiraceae bacterium]